MHGIEPSILYRRQRMGIIMMYKILDGLGGLPFDHLVGFHQNKLLQGQMAINSI